MVDRDVTVDFNADVSGYTASTTQAIALTKEYTAELDNMAGTVAKVGNAVSTGMVDSMSKLVRANEAGVSSAAAYQQQLSSLEGAVAVTRGNFGKLESQVKQLAREMPIGIGGAVRQFEALQKVGVPTERIAGMAKAFTQLEGATGESGAQLASMSIQLSRTFNNQSLRGVENLNDSLVKTTREMGASAAGTLSFANAIAPIAKQAGLSQTAVIGMSTAFSRVGEDGYRAANVMVKMMSDMDRSVRDGSSEMTGYANIVGKTRKEFTELFKSDPSKAIEQVFDSLNRAGPEGIRMLETIGFEGVRAMRSIQSVVGSGGLGDAQKMAEESYGGGATATAAEKAFGGLNDQMTMLGETMNQMTASAGKPFLGFLESIASAANKVAGIFEKVGGSGLIQGLVGAGGIAAAGVGVAAGATALGTPLAIAGGLLGGSGKRGQALAGFMGQNRSKLLMAGAGGLALSGMSGAGGGLLLPAMMAMSFMGGSNPLTRTMGNMGRMGTEAFQTRFGQGAWQGLGSISRGEQPGMRDRYSRAYRQARSLVRPEDRPGLMRRYATGNQAQFAREVEDLNKRMRAGQLTPGEVRNQLGTRQWTENMTRGEQVRRGVSTVGRAGVLGLGGMVGGVGRAGLAMVGGAPGLALMGAAGLGMGAYSAMQTSRGFREERLQRREEGDTTSALNDFRTALGLSTVAAQNFSDVLGGFAKDVDTSDTTLKDAFTLTDAERRSVVGSEPVIQFGGDAQAQAAKAISLIGESSDKQYIDAIIGQVAAANQGDRGLLDETLGLINEWEAGGRGGGAAAAVESIGNSWQTRGGWLDWTSTYAQAQGAGKAPDMGALNGVLNAAGTVLNQFQGANEEQMAEATFSGQRINEDIRSASLSGGAEGVQQQFQDYAEEVSGAVRELMEEAGVSSYQQLPQAQKELLEELVATGFELTDKEAAEFFTKAANNEDAVTYVMNNTASGQAMVETALEADKELRNDLMDAFDTASGAFDSLMPVFKDLAESGMTTGEYIDENRAQLGVGEQAVMQAMATPGDLGARYLAGLEVSRNVMEAEDSSKAFAELQAARGEEGQGSPLRMVLDQGAAQYRQDRQLERMSMSSPSALRDVQEQGAAALAAVTQAQAEGVQLDEQVMAEYQQDIDAGVQAREQEKQFMIQRITQMREHNIARERMSYDFGVSMQRQEDSFYRQRGYSEARFQRQQAYSETDFFRSRGRAVEDFNLSVERAQEDYRISVARAEADFNRNRERMQADYQLSVVRAEEDFQVQRARAFEDYHLSLEREAEDHAKRMTRIAEDMASSFMDPFTRVGPEQTWSTGGLLRNLERQAELAQEQLATLDELRERGLSQGAIDTLNLADPSMARQVSRMGGMSEEEIAQMNAATGDRVGIAEEYMGESRDIRRQEEDRRTSLERQAEDFTKSLTRTDEDFQKSLARGAEDFQKSLDRTAEDFRLSLARGEEDFMKSLARNADDFNKQLARSWEDFQIQTARAQEEFRISMDEQLTEFNISMEQARVDHQLQLDRMEEDLKRSGEEIHGTHEEISAVYMEMLAGDAEAYKRVTTDTTEEMRGTLIREMSNIPADVKMALGPLAWMFGLADFDSDKISRYMDAYATAIEKGLSEGGAVKFAENVAQYAGVGYVHGGKDSDGGTGILPEGSYSVGRGPAGHGYNAIDLPAPIGTPIRTPWGGRAVSTFDPSFGNYTRVYGPNGLVFLAAHMGWKGASGTVDAGQAIGAVGLTGNTTGAHLHAEVYRAGTARDRGTRAGLLNPSSFLVYDTGGVLPHGGGAVNRSGKPEAIINNEQWRSLRQLGEEISRLNTGVTMDPRGMGIVGEVIGRHLDAWESKAARVSGYATAAGPVSTVQTYDHSTNVTGPIQVVSNDPVDMGRKMANRSRRRRAYQPIGGRR